MEAFKYFFFLSLGSEFTSGYFAHGSACVVVLLPVSVADFGVVNFYCASRVYVHLLRCYCCTCIFIWTQVWANNMNFASMSFRRSGYFVLAHCSVFFVFFDVGLFNFFVVVMFAAYRIVLLVILG